MPVRIEVEGLEPIIAAWDRFPNEYNLAVTKTLVGANIVLWENVPAYPIGPAGVNTSGRTGFLGRSLGSSMSGGATGGKPDIFTVQQGMGRVRAAEFGTRAAHASKVIGDGTQEMPWGGYWWTMRTIADKSLAKIGRLFEMLGKSLANFLEGKGRL